MEKSIITLIYFSFLFLCLFFFIKYRLYELDHRSLFQQPLFWAAIALPLLTCLFLGSFVWINKIHSFSLTSHGYERFLDISKLPLLILASAVPLVSIVNNLHRTKQTEKQISEAERKNKIDLYYNHLKFHLDLYKKIETKKITSIYEKGNSTHEVYYQLYIKHPQELYRNAYPKSTPNDNNDLEIDSEYIIKLHKSWMSINLKLKHINDIGSRYIPDNDYCITKVRMYFGLITAYEKTCKLLCLGGYNSDTTFIIDDKSSSYQMFSPFYDFYTLFNAIESLEEITNSFLDTCRCSDVNLYFPIEDKPLIYGRGIIEDWFRYSDFLLAKDFQPSQLSRLP
ncbi:hypothetical protein ACM26X_22805 [Kluyvera cryocrescens]|uniref:hypothetical protein n=1 Tax=Kluyvera cryocrescens TaxID=580 RepID=UPI0039F5C278